MTFYLMAKGDLFEIPARDASHAKRLYRAAFKVAKMPSGSVISKDRDCGFFRGAGKPKELPTWLTDLSKERTQISDSPTTADRLRAELSFNKNRADFDPVTDSSLTYGDLRKFSKLLSILPEAERAVEEYSCRTDVTHICNEMSGLARRLREVTK